MLTGVDYVLEDGGVYCLMGPSGMGKTTLLRILMDPKNPDRGDVEGLGRNDIAVMFQENRLLEVQQRQAHHQGRRHYAPDPGHHQPRIHPAEDR